MIPEGLADLDTLVHLCRDLRTRAYVSEAVGSYRAAAYRASIVTLWVAVVFDFIHKLKELEIAGDTKAIKVLEEFQKHQKNADVKGSWDFERKVLERACKEFEFISRHECDDLQRLFDDRNRCAHPAMNSGDEAYTPSAEQARLHIRNAVMHLLRHLPVQGQAALDRLKAEVLSEYFPVTIENAVSHFKSGPLQRPREALVRNFTIANLKYLLGPDLQVKSAARFISALGATGELHKTIFEKTIKEEANTLFRKSLLENRARAILRILRRIGSLWSFLDSDVVAMIVRHVEELNESSFPVDIPMALDCSHLAVFAQGRIARATEQELAALTEKRPVKEVISKCIEIYATSGSYERANDRGQKLIIPLLPLMTRDDITKLAQIANDNSEISGSFTWDKITSSVKQLAIVPQDEWETLFNRKS